MWVHTVTVKRASSVISGGAETIGSPAIVHASLPCLVEPIRRSKRIVQSVLGQVAIPVYQFTWGVESLQEGDIVEFMGAAYTLRIDARDVLRPVGSTSIEAFQTGTLEERL